MAGGMYRHQMPTEKLKEVQRQLADEIDELEEIIERREERVSTLEERITELEDELAAARAGE